MLARRGSRSRSGLAIRALTMSAALMATLLLGAFGPQCANAAVPVVPKVPVLVIDAGFGDSPLWVSGWLGPGATSESEAGSSFRLWHSKTSAWWGRGAAPPTFVLSSSTETGGPTPGALEPRDIAWALDRITAGDESLKALLIAQSGAGLQARSYLEGLGEPGYAGRDDVVGLIELGAPNSGLTLAHRYPSLDVWASYAGAIGVKTSDLLPGAGWISTLNRQPLPPACQFADIQGVPSRIGGFESDGLVTLGDSAIPTDEVGDDGVFTQTQSRASDAWSLTQTWTPLTAAGGATTHIVDESQVEQIDLYRGYPQDPDVTSATQRLYLAWFGDRMPTTHISTRLIVDISGSMAGAWSGTTKLEGARRAASDFVDALRARTSLPRATPEDLGLIMFATTPRLALKPTANPSAVPRLLSRVTPRDNTNVGAALSMAIGSFSLTPRSADKVVVLLSDGLNTAGQGQAAIMRGPVAKARTSGVRIDTIALGNVGDMDARFLAQVAKATGGSYQQSNDLFQLRGDFLQARFASLGPLVFDQSVKGAQTVQIATATPLTRRIEAAVLSEGKGFDVRVLRNGRPLPSRSYALQTSQGLALISLRQPADGRYSIALAGGSAGERAHLFAVSTSDVFAEKTVAAPPDNSATVILLVLAGVLVVGVGLTFLFSLRRPPAKPQEAASEETA